MRLTRRQIKSIDGASQQLWVLDVLCEAQTGDLVPPQIFIYQHGNLNGESVPGDPFPGSTFIDVVTASQLSELPSDVPTVPPPSSDVPFYRTSRMVAYCTSPEQAAESWAIIQESVAELVTNVTAAEELSDAESVEF